MTTIVLADDHQIVRQGLRALLEAEPEFSVTGEASDGLEVAALVEQLEPDVLLLDIKMPGLNGLEVTRQVRRRTPNTNVVILSMYASEAYVMEALRWRGGIRPQGCQRRRPGPGRQRCSRGQAVLEPSSLRACD